MNTTLLQTAVIVADQNGRKNAGKTNCGNENLVLSCKCDQGWQKKATPDEVSIKQPKTSLEFGSPSHRVIGSSQRNITVPRPVLCCRQFLQNRSILLFSLSNVIRSTLLKCLISNPLHSHRFPLYTADTANRSGVAVPFDKPSRKERQVDQNTNLSIS